MSQFNRTTLLDAALDVAHAKHFSGITRADIAEQAGCSATLVSHYLGSMAQAREQLVDLAKRRGCLRAINGAPVLSTRNSGRNGPVKASA
jgi:AcrR family transcriptional regulator